MKKNQIYFILSLLIFIFSAFSLATGAKILTIPLSREPYFPLGSIITELGLISVPCLFYFGISSMNSPQSKTERLYSTLFKVLIVLSMLWIPIGFFLSGNLSNSFKPGIGFQGSQLAMKLFWYISFGLALIPIFVGLIFGVSKVLKK